MNGIEECPSESAIGFTVVGATSISFNDSDVLGTTLSKLNQQFQILHETCLKNIR